MRKRRYEMLLPLVYNDGGLVEAEKHEKTREEIVARFGAVSHTPATLRGIWVHEGQRFEEDFVRLFVDVPDTRANRQFFVRLKRTLLKRFDQLEIYIASYSVDIL